MKNTLATIYGLALAAALLLVLYMYAFQWRNPAGDWGNLLNIEQLFR